MIWLIGNKGMLGSDVELLLKKENLEYWATDIDRDITHFESLRNWIKEKKFYYIINCSGYTNVDKAESEQDKAMALNGEGVKNLTAMAKEQNAVLIHISTDYVFDGESNAPYKEEDQPNPMSSYGKSKLKGEKYIIENLQHYFIIRTAWLYGKNGKNFVYTMLNLFKSRDKIKVVNDQYGTPTYTKDLAEVIVMIIKCQCIDYGIYHFTNEGMTTWYEFTKDIYKMAKEKGLIAKNVNILPIKTEEYPLPAKRPKYAVLSKEKIKKTLNIEIRHWQEALREFINHEITI